MQSVIQSSLIDAYRNTDYRILGNHLDTSGFILKIDRTSPELRALYKKTSSNSAAFLTACNPFSQPLCDSDNTARQSQLRTELQTRQFFFFDGVGEDTTANWSGEQSYLVLGISLEEAKELSAAYEQNALIWCSLDAIPHLILLR